MTTRQKPSARLILRAAPVLAAALLRVLHATLRYEVITDPGAHPASKDEQGIWCFWHRCLLASACYFTARPRTALLISRSFDGELIARTIERLGFLTARGSSSRGGVAGFRALRDLVRDGASAVFPADGPRGPALRMKPGAVHLAAQTGLPIGVFHIHAERAWRLRSWDGFEIPQPFSRVVVAWGPMLPLPGATAPADVAAATAQVETNLERVRSLAERHFGLRAAAKPRS